MINDDVPPSPGPILGPPSTSPGRFILQHFTQQDSYTIHNSPHNQDARLPADMSGFPPPIIVDMFYGCAALLQWGIPMACDAIELSVGSLYYDGDGNGNGAGLGGLDLSGGAGDREDGTEAARSPTPTETPQPKQKSQARQCNQSKPHLNMDKAMDLIQSLWARSGPRHQERSPSTQERQLSQDRVNAWLKTQ